MLLLLSVHSGAVFLLLQRWLVPVAAAHDDGDDGGDDDDAIAGGGGGGGGAGAGAGAGAVFCRNGDSSDKEDHRVE